MKAPGPDAQVIRRALKSKRGGECKPFPRMGGKEIRSQAEGQPCHLISMQAWVTLGTTHLQPTCHEGEHEAPPHLRTDPSFSNFFVLLIII